MCGVVQVHSWCEKSVWSGGTGSSVAVAPAAFITVIVNLIFVQAPPFLSFASLFANGSDCNLHGGSPLFPFSLPSFQTRRKAKAQTRERAVSELTPFRGRPFQASGSVFSRIFVKGVLVLLS